MFYLERDAGGRLVAIHGRPHPRARETRKEIDAEMAGFLAAGGGAQARALLAATDKGLARVVEDLVELLVRRHVILFTDLPEAAQEKIVQRRRLRRIIRDDASFLDEDEIL